MSEENTICEICETAQFRYTCPKCNFRYCSVECYKSPKHIKCSEEFYKSCIQEEVNANDPSSREDVQKIYEILKRIRETDLGIEGDNLHDPAPFLDSDDDDDQIDQDENASFEEDDENDIITRLQGIDLNDPDTVWKNLSERERLDFQKMIESGDILKLIPTYKPWWIRSKEPKIVEIDATSNCTNVCQEPKIFDNIKKFIDISKKTPSPCVHYNIWNILAAYSCIARFFNGEHLRSATEAVAHLVNLCSTLKYGTNFEDAEDAILSVEAEALSSGNGILSFSSLYIESREQLKEDVRHLMSSTRFKLIVLSDILQLFKLSRMKCKNLNTEESDYQKLFALRSGSVNINNEKLKQLIRKIEFLLSYVNREVGIV